MPNFEIHGFAQDQHRVQDIAEMLSAEISQDDRLLHEAIFTNCHDDACDGIRRGAPYIRIVSTVDNPAIPSLDELVKLIKPVCEREGLGLETMVLAGFYPKGVPIPE